MKQSLLKKLIFIDIVLLMIVLSYKTFLYFHESDFQNANYNNIKTIEGIRPEIPYSFAVFGSAENSVDVFQKGIIPLINADSQIRFSISTGDAVLDGAEDKYRILNQMLKKLSIPTLIGVGDTEITDGGDRAFYKHYGPFYFSFAAGDSYFIFLDTSGKTSVDLQEDWLPGELEKADSYHQKFVFMNDSPVTAGDFYIQDEGFRNFLMNTFSEHSVTCVFTNGSSYTKNSVNGVTYYASGGAGSVLPESNSGSDYHYLKVNVSADGVTVEQVKVPLLSTHPLLKKIGSLLNFIHSVFYALFLNLLLIMSLLLLLFLILYRIASKEVDYYRDFSDTSDLAEISGRLNIAMFTNNYLPFIGGVPVSISRLADALRKRGNHVVIFAPAYPGSDDGETDVFRCRLLLYRKTDKFIYAIPNIYSSAIEEKFNGEHFDIIHVHHPFWMGKKGLRLGQKYHIPVVLTYHTRFDMYADYLPFFKLIFKNMLSHRLIKHFAQKCDAVIAPTTTVKEYLENIGVSRPKLVLPTGLDFSGYYSAEEHLVKNIKEQYASEGDVLLCSVSRLAPEKNIDFLIKGLHYVKEKTTVGFKCIFIGNGSEKNHIQSLIDAYSLSNVFFLIGSVNPAEIPKYYLASDLFVFSSKSETQGMVLLEAMAGKCPVICVRSSGTDDVIIDAYNGYKTSEEAEKWAEKVIYLLENKEILGTMQTNASLFAQDFSIEKMAEHVETFYEQTILSKKSLSNKR